MKSLKRISCIIGTAGHIDHGKTSLVRSLTGMDTDRLSEEKKRGVSIDLGFAYIDFPGPDGVLRAAVVDVPGHERFIRNMLAGTTGIDMVLFTIAADDGVMPQTVEHLDIVRLLGIKDGVFVVTKPDLAGEARTGEVMRQVSALIEPTPLKGSPVVAASSVTGEGVDELKAVLKEKVSAHALRSVRSAGRFRLPVDRAFAVKGFGTVVTGTVVSGRAHKGDDLLIHPTGASVKVRGLQSTHMDVDEVLSSQRAAVNLSGVSHSELRRGYTLTDPALRAFVDAAASGQVMRADCSFDFFPAERDAGAGDRKRAGVKSHSRLKLHHYTGETLARVILAPASDDTGRGSFGRVVLTDPLLMLRGDRFILRDPATNTTIGGGTVLAPYISRRYAPPVGKARYRALSSNGPAGLLAALIPAGGVAMDVDSAALMLDTTRQEVEGAVKEAGSGALALIAGHVVLNARAEELKKLVIERITEFHRTNPAEAGPREDTVAGELAPERAHGVGRPAAERIIREIINACAAEGLVRRDAAVVSLPGHHRGLVGPEADAERAIGKLLSRGLPPPTAEELSSLGFAPDIRARALRYMMDTGAVVRLKENTYISKEAADEARRKLAEYLEKHESIKAAEFRDLLGCGRKLAIEILEYFDRVRVTLRHGDTRTLRR